MNISQLQYFVAAVRLGGFTSAAQALYVTPQTVSKAVTNLEDELSMPLFTRDGKRVQPTAFSRMAALRTDEALMALLDLKILASSYPLHTASEGELTLMVAHAPYRGSMLNGDDLNGFRRLCPNIHLSVVYDSTPACIGALQRREADAAIVPERVHDPSAACLKLFARQARVALARANPLAHQGFVQIRDLHNIPFANPESLIASYRELEARFLADGARPRYVHVPPTAHDNRDFFEKLGGAALVIDDPSLRSLLPSVVQVPFAERLGFSLPICFVRDRRNHNPALVSLERYLLEIGPGIERQAHLALPCREPASAIGEGDQ